MRRSKISLLSASFGFSSAIASSIVEKPSKLQTMCSHLKFMGAHQRFTLIKNCLMIPKVLYILRVFPCFDSVCELTVLEYLCQIILSRTLDLKFNEAHWSQASLPVKVGGLGIQSRKDIALATFLVSVSLSDKLVESILCNISNFEDSQFVTAIDLWNKITQVGPPNQGIIKWHAWDALYIRNKLHCILSSVVLSNAVHLSLVTANIGGGSEWLNALPIKSCGLLWSDEELWSNVGLHLGVTLQFIMSALDVELRLIQLQHMVRCAR